MDHSKTASSMKANNTPETPKPETTPRPAVKRRAKRSDLMRLREQIQRDSHRHIRVHQETRTLAMHLMELSADAKNGWEESSELLRNMNLTPANNETTY
jgi:hypothetical protein